MLSLRRVVGHSLAPQLKPGQILLLRKAGKYQLGDTVIAGLERDIIKRITKIENNRVYLSGKDTAHDYGWVEKSQLSAKVIWPRQSATIKI